MCKTKATCGNCGEELQRVKCQACGWEWLDTTCEACGRPLAYGGVGRPPVQCQPDNGAHKSVCRRTLELLRELETLLPRVLERGGGSYGAALRGQAGTYFVLANQLRDYSRQPRYPKGHEKAGAYKPKNGQAVPYAEFPRVAVTDGAEVLYASEGYALDRALAEGWRVLSPQPPVDGDSPGSGLPDQGEEIGA